MGTQVCHPKGTWLSASYSLEKSPTQQVAPLIRSAQKQGANSEQTFNLGKLQVKQGKCRITNQSLSRRERKNRETKMINCWDWGEKKKSPPHSQSTENSVCIYSGECCISFCLKYVPATPYPYLRAFRITPPHNLTFLSMSTSTDELLWTVKNNGWLQVVAAKPLLVWPLLSSCMWTQCHGAYSPV